MAELKRKPAPGQLWKHYKGGTYGIVSIGRYEPTLDEVVIYSLITAGEHANHESNFPESTLWVRPLADFLMQIKMDLAVINRFERIS